MESIVHHALQYSVHQCEETVNLLTARKITPFQMYTFQNLAIPKSLDNFIQRIHRTVSLLQPGIVGRVLWCKDYTEPLPLSMPLLMPTEFVGICPGETRRISSSMFNFIADRHRYVEGWTIHTQQLPSIKSSMINYCPCAMVYQRFAELQTR